MCYVIIKLTYVASQVGVALDETTTESDLDDLFWVFKSQARLSKVLFGLYILALSSCSCVLLF